MVAERVYRGKLATGCDRQATIMEGAITHVVTVGRWWLMAAEGKLSHVVD